VTQCSTVGSRRALIIEDEFLIALDLEQTMFTLGFDVCALAPSANRARSLAMSDQPDVALIDVYLEGSRDGIEIARWLRDVCEVPIVFVTAYSDKDTVERIHEQVPGAPVLAKPVYPETLADAVTAVTKHLKPGICSSPLRLPLCSAA
jgi:DNA-binding response OmpR family regulator